MRALRIHPASESPQDDVPDTLHRWTAARRAVLLEDKLEDVARVGRDLTTVLARIAAALERRAVS